MSGMVHTSATHNVAMYLKRGASLTMHMDFPRYIRNSYIFICVGIFLTVDSVRFGYREADARNGWNSLPPPHRLANYDEEASRENGSREERLASKSSDSVIDKSKIYDGEEGARRCGDLVRLLLLY
jgi:hypothetical protein